MQGVEFAGTLADFVRVDLRRKYIELMPYVLVTLLQARARCFFTWRVLGHQISKGTGVPHCPGACAWLASSQESCQRYGKGLI